MSKLLLIMFLLVSTVHGYDSRDRIRAWNDGVDTTYVWVEQNGKHVTDPNKQIHIDWEWYFNEDYLRISRPWLVGNYADCYITVSSWDTSCDGITQEVLDWGADPNGTMVPMNTYYGFMRFKGKWTPHTNEQHSQPCVWIDYHEPPTTCTISGRHQHCAPGCVAGYFDPNEWTGYDPNTVYSDEPWWDNVTPHVSYQYISLPHRQWDSRTSWYYKNNKSSISYREHWWEYGQVEDSSPLPLGWTIDPVTRELYFDFCVWVQGWLTSPHNYTFEDYARYATLFNY